MVEPIEIKKGQDFVKSVACYCWCCLFFSFFHWKDVKGICKREGIRRIGAYIVFIFGGLISEDGKEEVTSLVGNEKVPDSPGEYPLGTSLRAPSQHTRHSSVLHTCTGKN